MNKLIRILPILILALIASCSSKSDGDNTAVVRQLDSIAVVPTLASVRQTTDISFEEARTLDEGATYVTSVLRSELGGNPKIRFSTDYGSGKEFHGISGGMLATVQKIGKRLNADAVLMSSMKRYQQRVGGEYSVDTPASAEFSMMLIATSDGRTLWSGTFKETQQSLMSNLFSFGQASSRGFKWITVEDMVAQGLKEKLEECPYFK